MQQMTMIKEEKPINIEHHTYKRECRYTRGIHIPLDDMENIINHFTHTISIVFY